MKNGLPPHSPNTIGSLTGKRVLITGGLGFIGSNLAERCVQLGAKVTIYDCLDPRSGGNMFNVSNIKQDVNIILNDIRNFEGLSSAVLDQDIIFSCAAYTSHPNSMKEPYIDIDVNCKGIINLLEAGRRFNREAKLVHVGTSTQIGAMLHPEIDEHHPEFPVDIYSANKTASEKYVLVYGHAYKMRTTVIRLSNTYGPRSNIRSSDFGFMNYFIGLGLKGKEITVFGEGRQLRTITFIDDTVDALLLAAQNDAVNNKAYFAVSEERYSVREIAEGIAAVVGGSVKYVDWPKDRAAIEVGDALISNTAIRDALGWRAEWDLTSGLERTKNYYVPVLGQYLD